MYKRQIQTSVAITASYAQHDQLLYFLKEKQITVADEQYVVNVLVTIFVDQDACDQLIADLTTRFNDQLTIKKGQPRNHEVPYAAQS